MRRRFTPDLSSLDGSFGGRQGFPRRGGWALRKWARPVPLTVSDRLRHAREAAGMTQAAVADQLFLTETYIRHTWTRASFIACRSKPLSGATCAVMRGLSVSMAMQLVQII